MNCRTWALVPMAVALSFGVFGESRADDDNESSGGLAGLRERGWDLGDNRAAGFVDVNGSDQLVWSRSREERALIRARIQVVKHALESDRGALHLRTWVNDDRAGIRNLHVTGSVYDAGSTTS